MSYTPTFWKGVTMFTCTSIFTILGFLTQNKLLATYGSKIEARTPQSAGVAPARFSDACVRVRRKRTRKSGESRPSVMRRFGESTMVTSRKT